MLLFKTQIKFNKINLFPPKCGSSFVSPKHLTTSLEQRYNKMHVINKKTLRLIKESVKCRNRLAYDFNKVSKTIDEWIDKNSPMLTTPTALIAIKEELELPESENILEEQD